jgi:hypothetical protein
MNMTSYIKKITMLLPAVLAVIVIGCNDDEAITESMTDVSTRITGFSTAKAGTGAPLTVNGQNLDKVVRVFVGNLVVPARAFTAVSESSITFNVPASSIVGADQPILIVFPGSEIATKKIEVIPFQSVSDFLPRSAGEGETVTILGANLNVVTGVTLGTAAATITSQSPTVLKFTVPAGVSDGPITLTSEAGSSNTTTNLVACSNPASDCADGLNLNSGFELGAGDDLTNWGKWNGGNFMVATTTPGEVFRGSRALKVIRDGSLGDGQWRIQLASDLVATEIGASYTVYVWARASVAGGAMRVSTNPSALYTADQPVPITWTRLAFTFAAANEAQTRVVLDLNGNNTAKTTFFIDDVKLVKN